MCHAALPLRSKFKHTPSVLSTSSQDLICLLAVVYWGCLRGRGGGKKGHLMNAGGTSAQKVFIYFFGLSTGSRNLEGTFNMFFSNGTGAIWNSNWSPKVQWNKSKPCSWYSKKKACQKRKVQWSKTCRRDILTGLSGLSPLLKYVYLSTELLPEAGSLCCRWLRVHLSRAEFVCQWPSSPLFVLLLVLHTRCQVGRAGSSHGITN